MAKNLITVFAATGAQGSSVVDALVASGEFKVRGVTRDTKSSQALELSKRGVEVVQGDWSDTKSIRESLTGAYGVFANLALRDAAQELEIGKKIVDTAKELKVTHFIWSTLPDVVTETKGKWKLSHFTAKGNIEAYARKAGFPYHTYVQAPGYYQNFGNIYLPKKNEDGSLTFSLPATEDTPLQSGDIREFGSVVLGALRNPKGWGNGDTIMQVGETLSIKDLLQKLSKHLGVKVTLHTVPREVWKNFFPGAEEICDMYDWLREDGYSGRGIRDVNSGHKAKGSALRTYEEFLKDTNLQFQKYAP